jgi:ribosomal protein S18 acetylase RimI-like enzyme
MAITVRSAILGDEADVVRLWRSCNLVTSYNDPAADFRFALLGPNSTILVAEAAGRICGSVMVGHDGHRGWLYYLASAPEQQRKGTGETMVDAGEQWLRERKVPKVQLMIRDTNTTVKPFYERLGYDDTPRTIMSKWLCQAGDAENTS